MINELKNKVRSVQEKKLLHQDEVYNGALEDILLGLKSEPYRRADAVRRSQRRRIDNNRLSRTMEEMEIWIIPSRIPIISELSDRAEMFEDWQTEFVYVCVYRPHILA